jgi:thiol-disulfide isomerase/thioredoxin
MQLKDRYGSALTFEQFVEGAQSNQDMWRSVYRLAKIPPELIERASDVPGKWYLLALVEDWCGDAVNTIPIIARLAEEVPNLELRLLTRDENPDIMDAHLSPTGGRAIPIVMVLDDDHEEQAWWGSRPRELQEWVMSTGLTMERSARYREIRAWYAKDKGRAVLTEVIALIEGSVRGIRMQDSGFRERL